MSGRLTELDIASLVSRPGGPRLARAPGKAEPPKVKRRQNQKPRSNLEVLAQAMSEATLQENIRQMALLHGWGYYHTHRAEHSPAGFPDTVCVRITERDCRLLFAELKREGEQPTPAQQKWLDDLTEMSKRLYQFAGLTIRLDVHLWFPTQWFDGTIERTLA